MGNSASNPPPSATSRIWSRCSARSSGYYGMTGRLNLGDSYASTGGEVGTWEKAQTGNTLKTLHPDSRVDVPPGLKPKDLVGIPWRSPSPSAPTAGICAPTLSGPSPTRCPSRSPTARPRPTNTCSSSRSPRATTTTRTRFGRNAPGSIERIEAGFKDQYGDAASGGYRGAYGGPNGEQVNPAGRNKRSVWTVTTQPFPGAHFATFPPKLIEPWSSLARRRSAAESAGGRGSG